MQYVSTNTDATCTTPARRLTWLNAAKTSDLNSDLNSVQHAERQFHNMFIFASKHHQRAIEEINAYTLPVTTFQMIIQTLFVQERFITSKVVASQSLTSMNSAMRFQ